MAALSESPATAAGQVSADGQFRWDGQQWVPLPQNYREPTPWTRPMQLASAGLLALSAVSSIVLTMAFLNHDSVLRSLQANGTQLPPGTDINTLVNVTIGIAWAAVAGFGLLQLFAAVGSYLGWRWMFWGALVLFALSGLSAITNLASLANAGRSTAPFAALLWNEVVALASLAVFVWMLIGVIRFGPWAMKRPGR